MKNKLAEAYFKEALNSYKDSENRFNNLKLEFYKERMEDYKTQAFWILSTIEAYEGDRNDLRNEYNEITGATFY